MSFEIESLFREYQTSKSHQLSTYNQRAHSPMLNDVIGYIADVTSSDRMTNSYTVIVPQLNNVTLTRVPRVIPGAYSQANGVGHLPPPLRPGQPVIISFLNNRTSMPVISGTIFTNGQIERWDTDNPNPPQIDEKDSTNLALFPTPMPPEALAVKGDAEVKVHPLILRTASPTQPNDSATALEVPGTTYIHDSSGNVFSYFAGERIEVAQNEVKKVQGSRQSLADMPNKQAYLRAIRKQAEVLEAMQNWRTALGGTYELGAPRPASLRSRANFEDGNTPSSAGTLGQLPGADNLSSAMSIMSDINSLLDAAAQMGGKQMSFLQKTIIPIIKAIEALWGGYGKFGVQTINFKIDLPLNLEVSISVSYNATTGSLSINVQIGSSGTPITGAQPLPLRSEGTIVAGGYQQVVNPTITVTVTEHSYSQSTIYNDFPELNGYNPQNLLTGGFVTSQNIPYQVIASGLNNLNFATNPAHAITSLLTKYGVANADLVVNNLTDLVRYGSAFDFIKVGAVLDNPLNRFITTTLLTTVGAFPNGTFESIDPNITTIIGAPAKPSITQCPPIPPDTLTILKHAQAQDTQTTIDSLTSYFQVQVPDINDWIANLSNYVNWTQTQMHPFYPSLNRLYQGDTLGFLVLTIFLSSGSDIRMYPRSYEELAAYCSIAFPQAKVGIL